jgi:hypothetical protein
MASCCVSSAPCGPTAALVVRYGRGREQIADDIDPGLADIAPLARFALANPDVVERLRTDAPLNEVDPTTLHGGDPAGYTDRQPWPTPESLIGLGDRQGVVSLNASVAWREDSRATAMLWPRVRSTRAVTPGSAGGSRRP